MGFAVELHFDPATEARLTSLWDTITRAGIGIDLSEMGSRPHISLAVLDHVDLEMFRVELESFARDEQPLTVTLGAVGTFPSTQGVVYVAPVVTRELLALHERFHRRLDNLGIMAHSYYRPNSWVPHCTTAFEVQWDQIPAAVNVCRQSDVFHPAQLVAVGLVEFRPVCELCTFPLGSA